MDLTSNDFVIQERGRNKSIATFSKRDAVKGSGQSRVSIPQLGQFSNVSSLRGNEPVAVLLLDASDTDRKDWELAWPQIVSFLRHVDPAKHLAVYSFDPVHGLEVLQDYDTGHENLLKALQDTRPTLSTLLQQPGQDAPDRAPSLLRRDEEMSRPELLSLGRLQSLEGILQVIANHLADIAGTKSLIWFASRIPNPFEPVDSRNPVLELYRLKLLRAVSSLLSHNVTIYPVDARGLMPDHTFDAENGIIRTGPVDPREQNPLGLYDFSGFLELAERSGGKAYTNTNGFVQAFGDIASLAEGSYTLGFYVSDPPDNKFHSLRVLSKRDGVRLRYRPGYWNFSAAANDSIEAEQELKAALDSPFTASAIALQASAEHLPPNSRIQTSLYLDPVNLTLNQDGDRWKGSVTVICGQKDNRKRVFATPPRETPIELPDGVRKSGEWLKLQIPITLRGESETIRIAVRDDQSGRIGSIDMLLRAVNPQR